MIPNNVLSCITCITSNLTHVFLPLNLSGSHAAFQPFTPCIPRQYAFFSDTSSLSTSIIFMYVGPLQYQVARTTLGTVACKTQQREIRDMASRSIPDDKAYPDANGPAYEREIH